jgi:hypothetical protein
MMVEAVPPGTSSLKDSEDSEDSKDSGDSGDVSRCHICMADYDALDLNGPHEMQHLDEITSKEATSRHGNCRLFMCVSCFNMAVQYNTKRWKPFGVNPKQDQSAQTSLGQAHVSQNLGLRMPGVLSRRRRTQEDDVCFYSCVCGGIVVGIELPVIVPGTFMSELKEQINPQAQHTAEILGQLIHNDSPYMEQLVEHLRNKKKAAHFLMRLFPERTVHFNIRFVTDYLRDRTLFAGDQRFFVLWRLHLNKDEEGLALWHEIAKLNAKLAFCGSRQNRHVLETCQNRVHHLEDELRKQSMRAAEDDDSAGKMYKRVFKIVEGWRPYGGPELDHHQTLTPLFTAPAGVVVAPNDNNNELPIGVLQKQLQKAEAKLKIAFNDSDLGLSETLSSFQESLKQIDVNYSSYFTNEVAMVQLSHPWWPCMALYDASNIKETIVIGLGMSFHPNSENVKICVCVNPVPSSILNTPENYNSVLYYSVSNGVVVYKHKNEFLQAWLLDPSKTTRENFQETAYPMFLRIAPDEGGGCGRCKQDGFGAGMVDDSTSLALVGRSGEVVVRQLGG